MAERKGLNANEVLDNINKCMAELEELKGKYPLTDYRYIRKGWGSDATYSFRMRAVCKELSIFDWWNDKLSLSQLKQMAAFVKTAIKLGFTGYVCFKVGAVGCSHGMWAAKEESLDGWSPKCDTLFHSFRCDENYWDVCLNNEWQRRCDLSLKDVKNIIAKGGVA
jgi:hypothetical protein